MGEVSLELLTDASAAKAMAGRVGTGKVRHMEVTQLWLQDKVGRGEIRVKKVAGGENRADALTKYVGKEDIDRHLEAAGMVVVEGRSGATPGLVGAIWNQKETHRPVKDRFGRDGPGPDQGTPGTQWGTSAGRTRTAGAGLLPGGLHAPQRQEACAPSCRQRQN